MFGYSNKYTKALQVISQQFQQLTNIYVVKYINTGDRVMDGILSVMVNSMISILGSLNYNFLMYSYKYINTKEETDSPTDINYSFIDFSQHDKEEILKYKFKLEILEPLHLFSFKTPILYENS